jgi:hypothetical protein
VRDIVFTDFDHSRIEITPDKAMTLEVISSKREFGIGFQLNSSSFRLPTLYNL